MLDFCRATIPSLLANAPKVLRCIILLPQPEREDRRDRKTEEHMYMGNGQEGDLDNESGPLRVRSPSAKYLQSREWEWNDKSGMMHFQKTS